MLGHSFIRESCLVCVRVGLLPTRIGTAIVCLHVSVQTPREQGLSIASSSLLTIPSKRIKTNSLAVDGSETVGLVTEDLVYFLRGKFFGWR